MGSLSVFHWIIVLAVVLLLFGNRLPSVMGDLAKGIKNFKAGLKDDGSDEAAAPRSIPNAATPTAADAKKDETARN